MEQLSAAYLHPKPDYSRALDLLMQRGVALRAALFEDFPPEDRSIVQEPKDWFEGLCTAFPMSVIVTVNADPIVPLPWGLLYDPGQHSGIADGFWAVNHQVVALYSGMTPQLFRTARTQDRVRLLSGLNQEVFEKVHQTLPPDVQAYITQFLGRPVGPAYSTHGCKERWQGVGADDCIIHFFGHASGDALHFGDSDSLTADTFRSLFRRESRVARMSRGPSYVLSILNGCSTVSGRDSDSFMIATADPGFCGFIGAEAKVPDRFALLFGQELLFDLLVGGMSVREVMSKLWRKHLPMGLFYGCYAHPEFAVVADRQHPQLPAQFGKPNFHVAGSVGQ